VELAHRVDAQLAAQGHKLPSITEEPFKLTAEAERELAFALRDLVHNHISSKHLSTAYASASETARTGSGDCTEHAVLLAAVLKARHIPARVCHGLVYVEDGGSAISGEATVGADGQVSRGSSDKPGQFGWHMWTQGLVDGRWLDLDATLHVPYSVGHVLVGTSSMSDKEAHNNHMQMAALIGNIEMDLLEVSHKWR
jgi:transglutaminase-like putative cysteine protease